ncbi:MAG: zinc ribbon domain-containing protein [Bryobacteraceae bacterium]
MRCTCGAELPLDARFCHKCGKPQRDEDIPAIEPAPEHAPVELQRGFGEQPEPAAPKLPALEQVSWSNGVAVRVSLLMGVLALLLTLIAGQIGGPSEAVFIAALGLGGASSVLLYRRRTGVDLSILNGARLGWFTGFFGFLIVTALLALVAVALTDPDVVVSLKQQAKASGLPEENVGQFLEMFKAPEKLILNLAISFVMFTLLPACGGALSARLLKSR